MSWTSFVRAAASAETDRVKAQVRAAVRSLVLIAVAAILLLIGLAFVLAGVYASLADIMPAWQAGGIIGLAVLVLCLLLVLIAKKGDGSRRARSKPPGYRTHDIRDPSADVGPTTGTTPPKDILGGYRPSAFELALAAFVVGLVASRRPRRNKS